MAETFIRTRVGDIVLDAEVSEAHTSDLRITDNPVESGAAVSDHAVLEPKTVRIEGVIVDYEPSESDLPQQESINPRGSSNFLNRIPMVSPFTAITAQSEDYAARALSSYTAGADTAPQQRTRPLAPWMTGLSGSGRDQTGTGSRLQQIYESLLALQKSGETVDIQTGLRLYKGMLMPSISGNETQRGSLHVSITARELIIVETKSIAGVSVPSAGANKSGRAGAQSAEKASRGNTNPSDASADKNNSALKSIGGLFK